MNDIIIGKDTREPNVSIIGVCCYESEGGAIHISDHGKYYRAREEWFSHDLLIFKDSDEYDKLTDYINYNEPAEIEELIMSSYMKNMEPKDIVHTLIDINDKGFREGIRKAQNDVRKALGF